MQITRDTLVGYSTEHDIHLGKVKFIGFVKGLGKCFGIQLHTKLPGNNCNGMYAGIQYFVCLPGHGKFTTIEKLMPQHYENETSPVTKRPLTEYEETVARNLSGFTDSTRSKETRGISARNPNFFRTSHSMQNLSETNNFTINSNKQNSSSITQNNQTTTINSYNQSVNSNNEFDQNMLLQPDKTHLIDDKTMSHISSNHKTKSEIDLKDVIAGIWSETTEPVQPHYYSDLKQLCKQTGDAKSTLSDKSYGSYNNTLSKTSSSARNKSLNPLSHIVNGSKTLPKKTKYNLDRVQNKDNKSVFVSTKHVEILPKLTQKEDNTTSRQVHPSTSNVNNIPVYYDPEPGTTNDLSVGSLVEVTNDVSEEPLYGVIRWMGVEGKSKYVLVGVELEEEQSHLPLTLTDGVHNGLRFFQCGNNRALFVPLSQCQKDSRFSDGATPSLVHSVREEKTFGKECPIVQGCLAPLIMPTEEDVEAVCGKFRGIQGHHNSCYLDATLFAMFTYTSVFDSLLYRPKGPNDISHYEEVQRVLREEIVNPLRKDLFVRADRVMNLRKLLDRLSSVSGLTNEEKDPEEFLNSLLAQILKAEPFLKLNSGQEAYYYQLFVEKDDELELPTVQQLFEQSFLTSDIKLKEVPSCLIIQMPRFGKNYKVYPRILPSQLLDVTDIIENSPRQCTVCGCLAVWECRQCLGECGVGLESTAFCNPCLETAHTHNRRSGHHPKPLNVCQDFKIMAEHCPPPRLYMELFAVVCIETSHYVAFVKCGVGHEAPWCFFDSMADRKGERNGYNIPEMVPCPDISKWLSDEQTCRLLHENNPHDRLLPEHARRLLCDAYICMYQSPDVMMYR
ncbi:ubiquitin carboxyl-terminal hydrolase CYLD isoform X2 [Onthophagus taurus]|nr:ubiquitin carboxyl-terminal hydrolase CYLD isoform X2 [Onthophagus taurus]